MNERLGNESEKMLYGVRVRPRVFICFNYYAGAKVLIFTVISTFERRVIPSVFSRMNQIRFGHPEERVPTACRRLMYRALRGRYRANRFSFVMAHEGAICVSPHGSQAEMPAPPALCGHVLLKFETLVHLTIRRTAVSRIRPSNPAVASWRSTSAEGVKPPLRYIPETKNVVPGDEGCRGGRSPCAISGGITCGTLLAVLDAPAGGRHEATNRWGGQLVNKQSGKRR
ncbi:hypothetical protein LGN21_15300 [Burkholderia cepacia]|uniref:hypothetical protein n=1 Tax=Burkholderia cepacia TaxID=292 RepID=UPI001CF397C3|nr:hypothetical protein [Burkholderia cepacia]MCA8280950.1 hypothetical protein [Burkholderia cepacia]